MSVHVKTPKGGGTNIDQINSPPPFASIFGKTGANQTPNSFFPVHSMKDNNLDFTSTPFSGNLPSPPKIQKPPKKFTAAKNPAPEKNTKISSNYGKPTIDEEIEVNATMSQSQPKQKAGVANDKQPSSTKSATNESTPGGKVKIPYPNFEKYKALSSSSMISQMPPFYEVIFKYEEELKLIFQFYCNSTNFSNRIREWSSLNFIKFIKDTQFVGQIAIPANPQPIVQQNMNTSTTTKSSTVNRNTDKEKEKDKDKEKEQDNNANPEVKKSDLEASKNCGIKQTEDDCNLSTDNDYSMNDSAQQPENSLKISHLAETNKNTVSSANEMNETQKPQEHKKEPEETQQNNIKKKKEEMKVVDNSEELNQMYILYHEATKFSSTYRMGFDEFIFAICLMAICKYHELYSNKSQKSMPSISMIYGLLFEINPMDLKLYIGRLLEEYVLPNARRIFGSNPTPSVNPAEEIDESNTQPNENHEPNLKKSKNSEKETPINPLNAKQKEFETKLEFLSHIFQNYLGGVEKGSHHEKKLQKEMTEAESNKYFELKKGMKLFQKYEDVIFKIFLYYSGHKESANEYSSWKTFQKALLLLSADNFRKFAFEFDIIPNFFSNSELNLIFLSSVSSIFQNETTELNERTTMFNSQTSINRENNLVFRPFNANLDVSLDFIGFIEALFKISVLQFELFDVQYPTFDTRVQALFEHINLSKKKGRENVLTTYQLGGELFKGLKPTTLADMVEKSNCFIPPPRKRDPKSLLKKRIQEILSFRRNKAILMKNNILVATTGTDNLNGNFKTMGNDGIKSKFIPNNENDSMLMSKIFESNPFIRNAPSENIERPEFEKSAAASVLLSKSSGENGEKTLTEADIKDFEEKERENLMKKWQKVQNSKLPMNYSSFSFQLRKKKNQLVKLMNSNLDNNNESTANNNEKSYKGIHGKGFQYKNINITNNENPTTNNGNDAANNPKKMRFDEKTIGKFDNVLLFALNESDMTWKWISNFSLTCSKCSPINQKNKRAARFLSVNQEGSNSKPEIIIWHLKLVFVENETNTQLVAKITHENTPYVNPTQFFHVWKRGELSLFPDGKIYALRFPSDETSKQISEHYAALISDFEKLTAFQNGTKSHLSVLSLSPSNSSRLPAVEEYYSPFNHNVNHAQPNFQNFSLSSKFGNKDNLTRSMLVGSPNTNSMIMANLEKLEKENKIKHIQFYEEFEYVLRNFLKKSVGNNSPTESEIKRNIELVNGLNEIGVLSYFVESISSGSGEKTEQFKSIFSDPNEIPKEESENNNNLKNSSTPLSPSPSKMKNPNKSFLRSPSSPSSPSNFNRPQTQQASEAKVEEKPENDPSKIIENYVKNIKTMILKQLLALEPIICSNITSIGRYYDILANTLPPINVFYNEMMLFETKTDEPAFVLNNDIFYVEQNTRYTLNITLFGEEFFGISPKDIFNNLTVRFKDKYFKNIASTYDEKKMGLTLSIPFVSETINPPTSVVRSIQAAKITKSLSKVKTKTSGTPKKAEPDLPVENFNPNMNFNEHLLESKPQTNKPFISLANINASSTNSLYSFQMTPKHKHSIIKRTVPVRIEFNDYNFRSAASNPAAMKDKRVINLNFTYATMSAKPEDREQMRSQLTKQKERYENKIPSFFDPLCSFTVRRMGKFEPASKFLPHDQEPKVQDKEQILEDSGRIEQLNEENEESDFQKSPLHLNGKSPDLLKTFVIRDSMNE